VTFSDVLGDKQFNMFAQSISQYRTLSFSFLNLSRRFNYALQGYSQTLFFYGQLGSVFYDPVYSGFINRNLAQATTTVQGGSAFGIWPLNRYRRFELSGGVLQYKQQFNDPSLQQTSTDYQQAAYGRQLFQNGTSLPLAASFVEETTIFREFGPLSGRTMRLSYEVSPHIGSFLSRQTLDGDIRHYSRIGTNGTFAVRLRGFHSTGTVPDFIYFGGNSELRGYNYLEFLGSNAAFANAELRFPLIEAMLTPIGVLGGIRGTIFGNIGGAGFPQENYTFQSSDTITERPILFFTLADDGVTIVPVYGEPKTVSGWRLQDGRASYGIGIQSFLLGFPLHIDYVWKTTFNKDWEDLIFSSTGGSNEFRKGKFHFWIGYDF